MTLIHNHKSKARKKGWRLLQYITGVHRIHHIYWSYGWKLPFIRLGYFPRDAFGQKHGFKKLQGRGSHHHDCTKTGVY